MERPVRDAEVEAGVTAIAGIGREEVHRKIDRGERFVLVDALAPISYARSRLPGAVNLPPDLVYERAATSIPDRDSEIVVYCAGPDCDASELTARRLSELGYTNVRRYVGGKQDWLEAGLPLERPAAAPR